MSRASRMHLAVVVVYAVMVPIAWVTGLLESVSFVSLLSIWALVESRLAVYKASRAQDEASS